MEPTTFDTRNDMISIYELKQMVDDALKQGVREVEITKQVFVPCYAVIAAKNYEGE